MEHIVYSNFLHHLQRHNILYKEQHGFRSGRSCETQLLNTIDYLAKNLDDRKQTDVILLDFSKTFDKVLHHHLCLKLTHYGIRGGTLFLIENFLTERSQQVIVNGCSSNPTNVMSGVPQGTVLTPLLFLCYINDLPENVSSKARLYADDVLLYKTIHTKEDCLTLNTLKLWANKWRMMFNPDKCEVIIINSLLYMTTIFSRKKSK